MTKGHQAAQVTEAAQGTTHTPGPWVIETDSGWGMMILAVNSKKCISVSMPGRTPDSTDRANARLIAAAPDLLAALRDLQPHVFGHTKPQCLGDCEMCMAMKRARAAIARATGEQS